MTDRTDDRIEALAADWLRARGPHDVPDSLRSRVRAVGHVPVPRRARPTRLLLAASLAALVALGAAGVAGALLLGQFNVTPSPHPAVSSAKPSASPAPLPSAQPAESDLVAAAGIFGDRGLWATRDGGIYLSTDGGASWQRIRPPDSAGTRQPGGRPVFVLDERQAAIVTYAPGSTADPGDPSATVEYVVSVTHDGGRTWSRAPIGEFGSATYASVAFVDTNRGYVLVTSARFGDGRSLVYRTDDGGATWLQVGGGSNFGFVLGVGPGRDDVWAGANAEAGGPPHELLEASHDGGRTWASFALVAGPAGSTAVVDAPTFFDDRHGLLAITGVRFYRTDDGGRTWAPAGGIPVTPGVSSWRPAADASTWVVPGNPIDTFEQTTDGGQNWTTIRPRGFAPSMGPVWLGFWTPAAGAALAPTRDGDTFPAGLYVTSDGGQTWAGTRPISAAVAVSSSGVDAPRVGPATWWIDPAALPLQPGATRIPGFVLEQACASGKSPEGRVREPVVEYGADAIVVTFTITWSPGDQDCPSNPPFPVVVQLDQPLGGRALLDGSSVPPRDATREP
jgi:photosystem II stability/assembly factor-like uncharacterized protein